MTEFTLSEPIEHGGETIKSLTLRELNTGDIRRIGEPTVVQQSRSDPDNISFVADHEKIARHIAAMARLPIDAIDLLVASDYMALADKVQAFFTGLQTPRA